jgi:hypothetical protein
VVELSEKHSSRGQGHVEGDVCRIQERDDQTFAFQWALPRMLTLRVIAFAGSVMRLSRSAAGNQWAEDITAFVDRASLEPPLTTCSRSIVNS